MRLRIIARLLLGGALVAESAVTLRRFDRRRQTYATAARRAAELGRPLVVIGDPDAGAHTRLVRAYGCGDLCIDLHGCPQRRVMQAADLTQGPLLGVADDSAVVFVKPDLLVIDEIGTWIIASCPNGSLMTTQLL